MLERGELVWANFSPHSGHEQAGRRPGIIISTSDYNSVSSFVLTCPITSNLSHWPWKVFLPEGLSISGAVLVDQLKSIDQRSRNIVSTGDSVDSETLIEILGLIDTLVT